jgi:hypothetical protein
MEDTEPAMAGLQYSLHVTMQPVDLEIGSAYRPELSGKHSGH